MVRSSSGLDLSRIDSGKGVKGNKVGNGDTKMRNGKSFLYRRPGYTLRSLAPTIPYPLIITSHAPTDRFCLTNSHNTSGQPNHPNKQNRNPDVIPPSHSDFWERINTPCHPIHRCPRPTSLPPPTNLSPQLQSTCPPILRPLHP